MFRKSSTEVIAETSSNKHTDVTVSFPVRCLILFACLYCAQSILLGRGVERRDEDVVQGERNREMPSF